MIRQDAKEPVEELSLMGWGLIRFDLQSWPEEKRSISGVVFDWMEIDGLG
jgi:hypothetical protein